MLISSRGGQGLKLEGSPILSIPYNGILSKVMNWWEMSFRGENFRGLHPRTCPLSLQTIAEKAWLIGTKQRNSLRFSPTKVSCYKVILVLPQLHTREGNITLGSLVKGGGGQTN